MSDLSTLYGNSIMRPPPRNRAHKRINAAVGRLAGLLGTVLFALGTTRAILDQNWAAAVVLPLLAIPFVYGLLRGLDYWDDPVNRSPRLRCPCCRCPTVVLGEDEETLNRLACPLCEWQPVPFSARDPRPDPASYDIDRAVANFAQHYRFYSPDEAKGWKGNAPTEKEIEAKRRFIALCQNLEQQQDAKALERTWRVIQKAEGRLEYATALRLGKHTALLARVHRVTDLFHRLP